MPEVAATKRKAGWTTVAFGDVVRQVKDRVDPDEAGIERYVAGDHMDTDDLRIRRWGMVGDGYLGPAFHMRFTPGQVLYGSRRTYLRKVAVADFEGITANTTYVLEPKDPQVLLPGLLPFIMQTEKFAQHSIRESKGSVNPYVNFSDLAWFEFALPPIDEQRHIASLLSALERMRDSHVILLSASSQASTAHLESLLSRNRSKWTDVPASELFSEPPRNGLSPTANSDGIGLKTVSVGAVSLGGFNPDGHIKYANITRDEAQPFFVRSGDVFAIRGNGNRYLTGKVGLCRCAVPDLFYPDLLIRLRFDVSCIHPEFAVAQWNLPSVHQRLITRAKSSNGIWKINGQDVRAHRLSLPSLDEQKPLLATIAQFQEAVDGIRKRLDEAVQMKSLAVRTTIGDDAV